jgi:hypothetical protein
MKPAKIAVSVDSEDFEALRQISAAEIGDFLLSRMSEMDAESAPPDADKLISLGITLDKAGHEAADRTVLECLSAKPSARRVDIVASFLSGLWQVPFRSTPVNPESIRLLLGAVGRAVLDDDPAYMTVLALSEVMLPEAPQSIKAEVAAALRELGRHKYGSQVPARMSQSIIEKSIRRAGV